MSSTTAMPNFPTHPSRESEDLSVHPVANIFPMMDEKGLDSLAEDIKANGQRDVIELLDGQIIDGRNRHKACQIAGVEPWCQELANPPADLVSYVMSRNFHRRQMNTAQRAMVAARVRAHYEAAAKERQRAGGGDKKSGVANLPHPIQNQGRSREQAGSAFGVSGKSVDLATKVLQEGIPELQEAVERGDMAVSKAAKLADLTAAEQKEALHAQAKKTRDRPPCELLAQGWNRLKQVAQRIVNKIDDASHRDVTAYEECVCEMEKTISQLRSAIDERADQLQQHIDHDSDAADADETVDQPQHADSIYWIDSGHCVRRSDGSIQGPFNTKRLAQQWIKDNPDGVASVDAWSPGTATPG